MMGNLLKCISRGISKRNGERDVWNRISYIQWLTWVSEGWNRRGGLVGNVSFVLICLCEVYACFQLCQC